MGQMLRAAVDAILGKHTMRSAIVRWQFAEVRDDRALPADESDTPSYDGVLITVWVLAVSPA
jgi:hypothetical protein